jgi:hypothetical protein
MTKRLQMLQKLAARLPMPPHCEAEARRYDAEHLEFIIRYEHAGKKYFQVAMFPDSRPDLIHYGALPIEIENALKAIRSAIARGLAR